MKPETREMAIATPILPIAAWVIVGVSVLILLARLQELALRDELDIQTTARWSLERKLTDLEARHKREMDGVLDKIIDERNANGTDTDTDTDTAGE